MKDRAIIGKLARELREIAEKPEQDEKRRLWSGHNSFKRSGIPIYVRSGNWEKEIIDPQLECSDPFFRSRERYLRCMIFQDWTGDDFVIEPWIPLRASHILPEKGSWGLKVGYEHSGEEGGAYHVDAPIREWADRKGMIMPEHRIDEEKTALDRERLEEALDGILPVYVDRSPFYRTWQGDISTQLGYLRGMEQIMWDVMDSPEELKELLAFMRDGILKTHREAEEAGHWTLADHENQSIPYCDDQKPRRGDGKPVSQKELWGFLAAQEFALISPEQHEEFMLDYQMPILERYGLVSYGCCEDLSRKIDMVRKIPNLRRIAVSPFADIRSCAEQIGTDYIVSWRPNPSDTVCMGWDEDHVRRMIRESLEIFREQSCFVDICLKDVNTVQGEGERLNKFVRICREEAERTSNC